MGISGSIFRLQISKIYLGSGYTRMPQHGRYNSYRNTFVSQYGRISVASNVEYTRQSKQQRTGID